MGILKGKNEVGPLLLKLGVALAISFAGFLYTHSRFRVHTKHRPPSSGKSHPGRSSEEFEGEIQPPISIETMVSEQVEKGETVSELFLKSSIGDENTSLLPEFSELVLQEFSISGDPQWKDGNFQVESDVKKSGKDMTESELEIKELRDQVCVLQERERSLQMQLLEYYGLKEQENAIKEFKSHLKMKSMESKIFELKAQSMQAENQRLQDQLSNYSNVVAELESARKTVMLLRKQMKTENELAKTQLAALQEHVSTLQVLERESHEGDKEIQKKLQRLQDLENETTALRMNETLQQENMELVMKLESGKTTASDSNSEVPQIEVMDKTLEETNDLRELNKKLVEEIERLRIDRCADAEELVYLRWINACLRYELRNFQAEPGRSMARNLSKSLSPKSEEKAKKLIIEYACSGSDLKCLPDFDSDYYSPPSTITDTGEFDDSPVEARSAKTNNSSKSNLFQKLRRLVLGKHSPPMGRNSGSWSDWDRRSVSKGLADETLGPYLGGSFSSTATAEYISPAILSDVRSKSLRIDPVEVERITKKSRDLVDSQALSRSMSDVPRGRRLRIRPVREDISAEQMNFITTNSAGEILENIQEKDKIHGSQISSEKVELLKFAEVLGSSRRHSMDYKKQGFSSF